MTTSKKGSSTLKMVELAILSAIIIVFQLSGTAIKLVAFGGTNISLVLIPIAVSYTHLDVYKRQAISNVFPTPASI